jgi:glycosyltransferase involved in cell wall biosynthesis
MPRPPESVCLLGHHEKDYPRNRSMRAALEAAGYRVLEVHSRAPFPLRHLLLAFGYLRIHRSVRWVFITEGGHRLVPFIRILTALTGRRIVFDPFLSRYNTRIEDRRLYPPRGMQALICLWQDWSSTHAANALVFDTHEHQQYFYNKYGLGKPFQVLPPGLDESVFAPVASDDPAAPPRPYPEGGFQVLFYGSFIPLQGVEHIVTAAAQLKGQGIRITVIGKGQTYADIRAHASTLGLDDLIFLDPVPESGLIPYLVHADACLGIFGDTLKAGSVVPNKVVQAAAAAKAIITRDSTAIRRYFRDGADALLIPEASPSALAAAILRLRADAGLRRSLGQGARRVFQDHFSVNALAAGLRAILRD